MKKAVFIAIQLSMNLYAFSQSHPVSSPHALRVGDVISKVNGSYFSSFPYHESSV